MTPEFCQKKSKQNLKNKRFAKSKINDNEPPPNSKSQTMDPSQKNFNATYPMLTAFDLLGRSTLSAVKLFIPVV